MVDYITRYLTTIRERKVTPGPEVKPGYMRELLPDSAPTDPEDWDCIFGDIEKVIMPGVRYVHTLYTQQKKRNVPFSGPVFQREFVKIQIMSQIIVKGLNMVSHACSMNHKQLMNMLPSKGC
jgi:hypothetical protein